ncbi:glutathione peroxidase [Roseivivax halodurans JCM 10272]|uniref:Glutathione peroxidase n=1 Tax=Roseivivax halodurans JCM 10272 TaxID=1449350 RepID=X7EKE7_9RHOB|nr:glutathione peroxidase [Roseivivax halodurans]ETX15651.1 glutathione peroxidase [Roseivivax halodurans JCM 10272]
MFRIFAALAIALASTLPAAALERFTFPSIDGGTIDSAEWEGRPVLVVNTASRCAFTPQYDALQALYDRYRDRGLIVLAVPSNDFRQELSSDEAVKDYCEMTFGLDLPMTTITSVRGEAAHPFYRWLAEAEGVEPGWNFHKVLIGPDGALAGSWGSVTEPLSSAITGPIEAMLRPARG